MRPDRERLRDLAAVIESDGGVVLLTSPES